jgi:hypothetical protein
MQVANIETQEFARLQALRTRETVRSHWRCQLAAQSRIYSAIARLRLHMRSPQQVRPSLTLQITSVLAQLALMGFAVFQEAWTSIVRIDCMFAYRGSFLNFLTKGHSGFWWDHRISLLGETSNAKAYRSLLERGQTYIQLAKATWSMCLWEQRLTKQQYETITA